MTRDHRVQLHDQRVLDVVGARDDHQHHPKVDHPAGEHRGHRRQPLTQGPPVVDLAHRPGMADVLGRGDLGGDLIGGIDAPAIPLGQLHRAAGEQLTHPQQPLRNRGGFIAGGLTDHLDELHIPDVFENMFYHASRVRP
jgi:hypothetical protein